MAPSATQLMRHFAARGASAHRRQRGPASRAASLSAGPLQVKRPSVNADGSNPHDISKSPAPELGPDPEVAD
jgi:hypothetical protein